MWSAASLGAEPRNTLVYGGRELMYFLFHVTSLPETSLRPRADPPPTPLLYHSPFPLTLSQQSCRANAQQGNLAVHMPTANHQVQKEVGHQLCIPLDPLKANTQGAHLSHQGYGSHTEKGRSCGLGGAEAGGCSTNANLHKHTTIFG